MGYKSTLRTLAAAERRRQREAVRHQRELERQRKLAEKLEAMELARLEVEEYENYLDLITSVHKECGPAWKWAAIKTAAPPDKPESAEFRSNTEAAQLVYKSYEPSRLDRMLRRVDSAREKLKKAIEEAKSEDIANYKMAIPEYERQYREWEELRKIADSILIGDSEAYQYVIQQYGPFDEIQEFGSEIRFRSDDLRLFELEIKVNGEEIVPDQSKTLLKSGKLSTKKMTKTKYFELYQDYVCGCTLRVARELFILVPAETAIITSVSELLNTSTGHLKDQPILSVIIPRATLERLNFDALDPSDSMSNFVHNMKFLKTKGFQAVDRIDNSALVPSK